MEHKIEFARHVQRVAPRNMKQRHVAEHKTEFAHHVRVLRVVMYVLGLVFLKNVIQRIEVAAAMGHEVRVSDVAVALQESK